MESVAKPWRKRCWSGQLPNAGRQAAPEDPAAGACQKPALPARDRILARARSRPRRGSRSQDPHSPVGLRAGWTLATRAGPPRSTPTAPLPGPTPRCLRRWKGAPPPSCPLSPATQAARAPLGPVRGEETRAPRGHLPGPPCALRGGSQCPGGKGAGWGGAAAENRAGRMACAPRDASPSLAPPPRLAPAIRAGASGLTPWKSEAFTLSAYFPQSCSFSLR